MKWALLGTFAVLLLLVVSGVTCVASTFNGFVRAENGIKAQYSQNQNNYDNMVKKIREIAQVPEMYAEDLKKVYDSAIKGRYGADGSRAMFQWLKEQNPSLDPSLYAKIQQVIESGRNEFMNDQKALLDKKRVYENSFQQFPASVIAGMFGFPRIDLSKYDIVTSDATQRAFDTKRDEPLQLRPRQGER